MSFTLFRCRFTISLPFAALLALLLLFDRTGVMPLDLAAVFLHEAAHFLAMRAFGQSPSSVDLKIGRIQIKKPPSMTYWQEMVISAAGAGANLLSTLISGFIYLVMPFHPLLLFAAVNLFVGLFNLLPVNGLDGGRILRLALALRSETADQNTAVNVLSAAVILLLIACGLAQGRGNPTLLIFGVYLLILLMMSRKNTEL